MGPEAVAGKLPFRFLCSMEGTSSIGLCPLTICARDLTYSPLILSIVNRQLDSDPQSALLQSPRLTPVRSVITAVHVPARPTGGRGPGESQHFEFPGACSASRLFASRDARRRDRPPPGAISVFVTDY